jgi:hypothetical protein
LTLGTIQIAELMVERAQAPDERVPVAADERAQVAAT